MEYYESLNINVLLANPEYLIESFLKLYNSIKILSNDFILVEDMDTHNLIRTNNGLVVIDMDLYQTDNYSRRLFKDNRERLFWMMDSIIMQDLSETGILKSVPKAIWNFDDISDKVVDKKLGKIGKVKRLIDYL